ncbi:MAG: hypothetical protein H6729_00345 [Deltaproteobacteria bacterium]|nr:hypothetical protein [Deltaproteobacteria bacterium]
MDPIEQRVRWPPVADDAEPFPAAEPFMTFLTITVLSRLFGFFFGLGPGC